MIYNVYQLVAYVRDKSPEKQLELSLSHFLFGPLAWPIMIPEAIEYLLADLGLLRAESAAPATETDPPPADFSL